MENKTMLSMDQLSSVAGGADQGDVTIEYYIEHDCKIISGPFYTSEEVNAKLQEYKDARMTGLGIIRKYSNQ